MIFIIVGLSSCLLGAVLGYSVSRRIFGTLEIIEQNKTNQEINQILEEQNLKLNQRKDQLNNDCSNLLKEKELLEDSLEKEKKRIDEFTSTLLQERLKYIDEKFDRATEEASKKFQNDYNEFTDEYLKAVSDATEEFAVIINTKKQLLKEIEIELNAAKDKQSALIELNKNQEKEKNKKNYYKLQLSEEDIKEIKKIREIIPYLRNIEPLNKVIYKVYYEKPFTDLIGRILSKDTVCGIYKITNLTDNKVYIGQSRNIKERFRTHIKRGVGAESGSRNKLYNAMLKDGVENFSFELLEECPKEDLNQNEKYWISFFKSQEFGYNETKGGS